MPPKQPIDFELLEIRAICPDDPLTGLSSGDADLDEFLADDALQYECLGAGRTHVAFYNGALVGFVTLSADALELKSGEKKRLGSNHLGVRFVPAIKIGRLAVNQVVRESYTGIGKALISYAWFLADQASQTIGCRLLTVDAYENAVPFYTRMGFTANKAQRPEASTTAMHLDLRREDLPFF